MNAYWSKQENQFLHGKIAGMSLLLALTTVLPANAQSYNNISLKDSFLGAENAAHQFYHEGREQMEIQIRQREQQSQYSDLEQKKPLLQIEPFNTSSEENSKQTPTREIDN
ncbi:hypothetical protein IQ238_06845 [Pleurocapsales cyanobacterium LEGE 06147]|nr:hypothetical protein [Pleurocapsales cyanobacterium LEGE 06147]